MASPNDKPFRFTDLPTELRLKVYGFLLCSFEPDPNITDSCNDTSELINSFKNTSNITKTFDDMFQLEKAKHSIDTTILRTNSQIHREAYNFMVKTNRLVLVRSTSELPLEPVLQSQRVPVVTVDAGHISQFKGFVVELVLSTTKPLQGKQDARSLYSVRPMSVMVLARDLDTFCEGMSRADGYCRGFSTGVSVVFHVAPTLDYKCPRYKDSLNDFFSEGTQKSLLEPLRTCLHGFVNVKVCGHVLPELAKAVETEVGMGERVNWSKMLNKMIAKKEKGTNAFRAGLVVDAFTIWLDAMIEIDRVRHGASWSILVAQGDQSFVGKIAELQFTLCLNAVHVGITTWGHNTEGHTSPQETELERSLLDHPFNIATRCLTPDFWREGYTYQPSDVLLAKLRYRQAMCLRLRGDVLWAPSAIDLIDQALQLLPDDPKVKDEHRTIMQWFMSVHN